MESNDSQDNSSGKGWMEFMFIFSFVLFVIGLILDDTMASSDPGSFQFTPRLEDFIGVSMIVIGGLMFLFTGLIVLLKRL